MTDTLIPDDDRVRINEYCKRKGLKPYQAIHEFIHKQLDVEDERVVGFLTTLVVEHADERERCALIVENWDGDPTGAHHRIAERIRSGK